ncbi:MAG: T9SS type A sorting domain-containing protein [Bacteroidota bacterium]|nr:T9SS type A sorting domain-containing protein [Bacteroidota bacterium]
MKKIQLLTLLLLVFPILLSAQDIDDGKVTVSKPVYFDKTPPLRNMKIILPGERDRSWKDNLVGNRMRDDSALFANKKQVTEDLVLQENMGTRSVSGPIYNWDGVPRLGGIAPSDTDGDVGPDHYFQMVNLSFAIWDKQGTKLYGPVDNSTLWNGFIGPWTGTNDGDPIVLYDDQADRWIATQFAVNTSNGTHWQLIAVSETGDPTGAYYRYAYQFSYFNDYPKFSVWPDGYYCTFNAFGATLLGSPVIAFERDSMLVGSPNARMVQKGPYGYLYGTKTAHLDGNTLPPAGSPCWAVDLDFYGSPQTLDIYKFEVNWNNVNASSFVLNDALSITQFSFFPPSSREHISQPNTTQKIDALSKYLMYPLQYRNFGTYEVMLVNHTVKVGTRAGVRWYEMRKDAGQTHWYLYQEGTYAPNDGESRWMGSLAMNAAGEIALGYSVSSANTHPSVRYTGRTPGSPLGVMDVEEVTLVEGTGSQNGVARWGDYSAMSVDPSNDSTFWYTQEYMPGNSWGTRISAFDFGPPQVASVYAGPDSVICHEEVYYGQGNVAYALSYEWTTLGDGLLMFANTLEPAYVRGDQDLENGYFELVLSAIGFGPGLDNADTVHVDLQADVVVDAGNDTLVCIGESIQMQPEVLNGDSLIWSTAGDGTFNDTSLANAIYTPGEQDIIDGEVLLTLYAQSAAPCEGEDEDDLILTVDDCTGIGEGVMGNMTLEAYPNPSTGVFNIDVNGVDNEQFTLKVLNMRGRVVFNGKLNFNGGAYNNQLDFSYLPKGVYYLVILNDHQSITKKIVFK